VRRHPKAFAWLILLMLGIQSAAGYGAWQWLRGSALTDFKDSDWEIIKATARVVLNDKPDREQVNWSNPDTGNRGSIMALATFTHQGRTCRRAAMRNLTHRGREDRAVYSLCQQADGDWIFVAESALVSAPPVPSSNP
jgi:surface antigen